MTRNFHLPGRSPVMASNAMAATSHPLATLAAIEALRAGGTAADAALNRSRRCVSSTAMTGSARCVCLWRNGCPVGSTFGARRRRNSRDARWHRHAEIANSIMRHRAGAVESVGSDPRAHGVSTRARARKRPCYARGAPSRRVLRRLQLETRAECRPGADGLRSWPRAAVAT